jgi:multiple sugar transport system ATP-binding protein
MADVELQKVTKRFGRVTALNQVSFDVRDGEFFVLLGPTGAGKTTTLRVIAGLERPEAGSVQFNGEAVDDVPPADRDVAFVFQQYSLYPTMSVYDNLAFPLRSPLRRLPEPEIRRRIGEAADRLRISRLLDRRTAHLSGGEMQRVSIGRAIVRAPAIFLMDEPLSNLDFKLREALRVEIKHLQKTQHSTTLFVTHDQVEALTMADRIGVLQAGQIVQVGTPEDIYDRPADTFVAQLVGTPRINLLEAKREDGVLSIVGTPIRLPLDSRLPAGMSSFILGIRPEDLRLHDGGESTGRVVLVEPLGAETVVYIRAGDKTLISTVAGMGNFKVGEPLSFDVSRERLHYFDPSGKRLAAAIETPC